jgi:hypothetical protein
MELKEMTEEKASKIIESAGEYIRNREAQAEAQAEEEAEKQKEVSEEADQKEPGMGEEIPFAAETPESESAESHVEDALGHEKS